MKYTDLEKLQEKRNAAPGSLFDWGKKMVHTVKHRGETDKQMEQNAYQRAREAEEDYKAVVLEANDVQSHFKKKTEELKYLVHGTLTRRTHREIKYMAGV